MRRLEHCNIVKLKYFFYSSGEKVSIAQLNIRLHSHFLFACLDNIRFNTVILLSYIFIDVFTE